MRRDWCRHCGDCVPHDAPSRVCSRCACLPVAERGYPREPGSAGPQPEADDDLGELLIGIDEPDPPALEAKQAPASNPDISWLLLDRLSHAGERRYIVWLQGRIKLLSRCATAGPEWSRPQPH